MPILSSPLRLFPGEQVLLKILRDTTEHVFISVRMAAFAWLTMRPVRNDGTLLISKTAVTQAMIRLCPANHHCRLEGRMEVFKTLKTIFIQDYQPAMAATLAAALVTPETPHFWDFGFAVQEIQEHLSKMIDLCLGRRSPCLNCFRAVVPMSL